MARRHPLAILMASHRGPHPEDEDLFCPEQIPTLRAAVHDLSWLRTRGYGDAGALKLVGDRYKLRRRQRNAVARSACSDEERDQRIDCRHPLADLEGAWIDVDGFNVLISMEGALGGAYLFVGRDGAVRDVAAVQKTYRVVEETVPAIRVLRRCAVEHSISGIHWMLDAQVSNVGRIKEILGEAAPASMGWEIDVQNDVDAVLQESTRPVATSDSEILDAVNMWCSIEREGIDLLPRDANLRDLRPKASPTDTDGP